MLLIICLNSHITDIHAQLVPQATDLGDVAIAGNSRYDATLAQYTLTGSGTDLWSIADSGYFAYRAASGDATIVARVTSLQNTNAWAKAGIAIRESLDSGARNVVLAYTPGNGITLQFRSQTDQISSYISGGASGAPAWLKLVRTGNIFTGYRSADGQVWTLISSTTVAMSQSVFCGLVVTSHRNSVGATAILDHVQITCAGVGTLPSPWTYRDLGTPGKAGYSQQSNGTFELYGSGADFWGVSDSGQFASQPLVGDGEITTRVVSQDTTNEWAKSGLFIRESLDAGARNAFLGITPAHGLAFQRRTATGQATTSTYGVTAVAPIWLKLQRKGTEISSWQSINGVDWLPIATENYTDLAVTLWVGLGVTSHQNNVLNHSVFDQVSVHLLDDSLAAEAFLPFPWKADDVGAVGKAGLTRVANGKWQILGGGADIWGVADAFHFAYQPTTGNATLVARIDSQQNTNEWAKSGLMIRESLDPSAPYVFIAVTPLHGIVVQKRAASAASSVQSATKAGSPVIWLKMQRTGNSIVCSTSSDGLAWTMATSVTLSISPSAFMGIAVTAHNNGLANYTALSNVSFSDENDTNGNGLADTWELQYLGNLTGTKYEDPDGDGLNNLQEYIAQTNPVVANILSAPYSLAVTSISDVSVGLAWQSNQQSSANVSYNIYRGTEKIATVAGTSFVDTTIAPGTTYSYQVDAGDENGNYSAKTSPVEATSLAATLDIPWYHQDIGAPAAAGTAALSTESFIITHQGSGLAAPSEESVHFVGQQVTDSFSISATAKVESSNADPAAMAGLMFRNAPTAGAPFAAVAYTVQGDILFISRLEQDGDIVTTTVAHTTKTPSFRLCQVGPELFAFYTFPNETWQPAGSATCAESPTLEIGFFASSSNKTKPVTARVKNITLEPSPVELQNLDSPADVNAALGADNVPTVSWGNVAGASSYNIYRNGQLIATVPAGTLSYRDSAKMNPFSQAIYSVQSSSLGVLSPFSTSFILRRPPIQYNGNPNSYKIKLVGGQRQKGSPGSVASLPIVIVAIDTDGNIVQGAPVKFGILNDGSTYSTTSTGTFTSTLNVNTDATGTAEAYFTFPSQGSN